MRKAARYFHSRAGGGGKSPWFHYQARVRNSGRWHRGQGLRAKLVLGPLALWPPLTRSLIHPHSPILEQGFETLPGLASK